MVSKVPERRALELLSTFVAAATHALEEVVSEEMVPGVVASVARLLAKDMYPSLGDPKDLNEMFEAITKRYPASFEPYVNDGYFVVRDCPIRDIAEKENVNLGGPLCIFARSMLWYFVQKTTGKPNVRVEIVKPGYYACLCSIKGASLNGMKKTTRATYDEYVTKTEEFLKVLLKGILEAFKRVLGDVAKGYLVNAGRFAGYAHGSSLPYFESLSDAVEAANAYLMIWEGEAKLGEGAWVLEEKKYELGYPKDDLFCSLFYGYLTGLLSAITGRNVSFDNYGCEEKKVMKLE